MTFGSLVLIRLAGVQIIENLRIWRGNSVKLKSSKMGTCFLRGNSVKVKIFLGGVGTFDLMNISDGFAWWRC